jgi:hypothetical protein
MITPSPQAPRPSLGDLPKLPSHRDRDWQAGHHHWQRLELDAQARNRRDRRNLFHTNSDRLPLAVTVVWLRVSEGPGPSRISPQVRLVEGPSQLESTPLDSE